MSIELILSQNYNPNKNLACNLFMAAAIDTWQRIQFTRTRPPLKIFEATITQNIVYELNLLKQRYKLNSFTIFEAVDEKANGDDLEICVQHSSGLIYCYAVQSKIIYHSLMANRMTRLDDGVYKEFEHSNKNGIQIDLLIDYARNYGCVPLYLLYNYVSRKDVIEYTCDVEHGIRQYGCGIVSAHYLKKMYSNIITGNLKPNVRFSDLYGKDNPMLPWLVLACCDYKPNELLDGLAISGLPYEVTGISPEVFNDDQRWDQLITYSGDNISTESQFQDEVASEAFNPKYRIFINPNLKEEIPFKV